MAGQVVRVKREIFEACMTCPLCKKLLKEATTISLCLHTCKFIYLIYEDDFLLHVLVFRFLGYCFLVVL